MKLGIVDGINENHVVESFIASARSRNLNVAETGRIWKLVEFPVGHDEQRIWGALEDLADWGADVIFNFRASAVTVGMLRWLKSKQITTAIWLPDDPVFFESCYRYVAGEYDLLLNCGSQRVLEYYEKKLGVKGWNFPFWTGRDTFQPLDRAKEVDAVFLGGIWGSVRDGRYQILADLPCTVRQYGKVSADPKGLNGGWLERTQDISEALARARVAINIPQVFAGYADQSCYFPELSGLGSFQVPSRLVQYAACGIPVISLFSEAVPGMDGIPHAADEPALHRSIKLLLEDEELRRMNGAALRRGFEEHFTADRRIGFLIDLVNSRRGSPADAAARSIAFLDY